MSIANKGHLLHESSGTENPLNVAAADDNITLVKGNGPAPGYHHGPDNVRTAVYFEDPDGLVVEVYSTEIEMIETNRRLLLDRL